MEEKNQTAKIAISQKAEVALDRMVQGANEGFLGGRITKHQLASWVIERYLAQSFEVDREVLRQAHFDKAQFLAGMAEKLRVVARGGGDTSEYEAELLRVLGQARRPGRPKSAPEIDK